MPTPRAETPTAPDEAVEPIDLLRLTGSTGSARWLAGIGALLLAVVVWRVIRRIRR